MGKTKPSKATAAVVTGQLGAAAGLPRPVLPGTPPCGSQQGWVGRDLTRLSGSSSLTRHPCWHQWQTQAGSCSAGNFIKRGLGMRTEAPTGQGARARAQDACEETPPPGNRRQVPRTHQPGCRPSASSLSTVPGLLLPARQARVRLSGQQAAGDTGQGQPVSAVSPAAPAPHFLRKLHLCHFPEHAGSPLADTTSAQRAGMEGDCPVPTASPIFTTFS